MFARRSIFALLASAFIGGDVPALAAPAQPSFDCARASTPVENLLCVDHGLARQDRLLAATYKRALERADGVEEQRIRADQRRWASGRAAACPGAGPAPDAAAIACLGRLYEARLEELRPLSFDDLTLYEEVNVRADQRAPLACLRFSEPLAAKQSAALESYVESAGGEPLAAHVVDNELCVLGLAHGSDNTLTVHAGLRGAGAILRGDATVSVHIPDRPRRVAFPSKGVILPRLDAGGLPIETVNLDAVRLLLLRVDDEDVVKGLQRGVIEGEVGYSEVGRIASKLGRNVWTGEIEIDGAPNVATRTAVPIGELVPGLEPGVYLAVAEDPEADYGNGWWTSSQWFVVSDIGLTTFIGEDGLTVAARTLSTAAPATDVRIVLKAEDGRDLAEARTDASGIARIEAGFLRGDEQDRPRAVYAYGGDGDFVYVDVTRAPLDLSDRGVDGRAAPGALDAYLTADRGVYRPGGTVRLTAILRDAAANAVEGLPLTLTVTRPDGLDFLTEVLLDKGAGGYSASLPLPATAATGVWRASLATATDAPPIGKAFFLVEDFVPPRLEMTLAGGLLDEAVFAELSADYLYGAPGADLPGEVIVVVQPAAAPVAGFEDYAFGRAEDEAPQPFRAALERFVTDAEGKARVVVSVAGAPSSSYPLEASVRTSVFDSGGRPLTERTTVNLANLPLLIGVRSNFDEGPAPGFDVMAFGPDGAPAGRRLSYAIVREEREYLWFQSGGRWDYRVQYYETEAIAAGEIDATPGAPVRISSAFERWGAYRLTVTDPETDVATSVRFHAGPWGAKTATADAAPDKVKVTLPPGPFAPGETVVARIEPPFDAEVMAAVVDSRVGAVSVVHIPASGGEIELRLPEGGAAGAYILVNAFATAPGAHSLAPRRAIGAAWAGFDAAPKTLDVAMAAPAETMPERTVDVRLIVGDRAGPAFVTLAAIDDGVLALTGYEPPDPRKHFLAKRRLGVDIRDIYGRFIDAAGAKIGRVRSGGGAARLAMQAEKADAADLPKKSVRVVALFSGVVEADADGVAIVPISIPEFSGRLRLMAQAWSRDKVGAAETTMLVRRPVVAALSLPRFLSPGDNAVATISLRNLTGPAGAYSASVTATGAATVEGGPLMAELRPGGPAARIAVSLTALEPGDADFRLSVSTPDGADFTIDRSISVRPAAPVETRSVTVDVAPGRSFAAPAGLMDNVYASSARVIVGLNPLPDMDLPSILTSLSRYPYGCAEQTTSTAAPLLYSGELSSAMGIAAADRSDAAIEAGVARLLGMQTYTGGFGFWNSDFEASPWITVYATDFLVEASRAGFEVPQAPLERALTRLEQFTNQGLRPNGGVFASAYALYVRARAGVADPARVRRFADGMAAARPPALALGFAGAALATIGDRSRAQRFFDQALAAEGASENVRYQNYGSDIRDDAALLSLMAASDAAPWPDLRAAAERLGGRIRASKWLSTQEKAWIVRAAASLSATAEARGFAVEVDGGRVDNVGAGLYRTVAGGAPMPRLTNLGHDVVTGVVSVVGALRDPAPALNSGFSVERAYYGQTGNQLDPADIRQNDLVVVVLSGKQTAPGRARALLVDYLPAGLELENARIGGEQLGAYGWLGDVSRTEHIELRDDRFVAAFNTRSGQYFRLAYLARAVTPGRFVQGGARVEAMYRAEQFGRGGSADVVIAPR